ncbi:MAG: BrnT family toxin [Acidobacteria bacterium]|nr:BrnT family toxin [Acidobacteriota bacterium]MBI3655315.1 BrnT family toxin [Acidobacteriota bacterium]
MRIEAIIWKPNVVDKLIRKHGVSVEEVEQVFRNRPRIYFQERGMRQGEDVYRALGRADEGRYLMVIFIYKGHGDALVITARGLDGEERRQYGKK